MPRTLRRSCAACAKAKHSCDLQTPKCSRCTERNSGCVYANEPLTSATNGRISPEARNSQLISASSRQLTHRVGRRAASEGSDFSILSATIEAQSVDPFDTFPQTNLPRARVQGLIHHFLSKIVYQYYPWDTNPNSNPFVTSWWHLALSDPALFHVSLQTASLDDELRAQKGFIHSEILMRDSVSLIRKKIQDPSQAFQDATMNAVVTLAAIEHGKGNNPVSMLHIEGVKSMVQARGGISRVKLSNPLTARMVSWISMLVMGSPQFQAEDGFGNIIGVDSIPHRDSILFHISQDPHLLDFRDFDLDPVVEEVLTHLRSIFHRFGAPSTPDNSTHLSIADRQDLASFVIHKLLLLSVPIDMATRSSIISESIRYATCIYMFMIHGPTYYSHMSILKDIVLKLQYYLIFMVATNNVDDRLIVWLFTLGMVASIGTEENEWFITQTSALPAALGFHSWEDVKTYLTSVLWLEGTCGVMFRQAWEQIIAQNQGLAKG